MPLYKLDSGDYTGVNGAKTLIQLVTPTTRRAKLKTLSVSFGSVTSTDTPVLIEIGKGQTSGGTSSSFTPLQMDEGETPSLCSALNQFTVEPTGTLAAIGGDSPWRITPIGGTFVYQWPQGEEYFAAVSSRIAVRVTTTAALTTPIRAYLIYLE